MQALVDTQGDDQQVKELIAELQRNATKCAEDVIRKSAEIEQLKNDVKEKERINEEQMNKITEQNERIANLTNKIDDDAKNFTTAIESVRMENENLRNEIKEKENEIESLSRKRPIMEAGDPDADFVEIFQNKIERIDNLKTILDDMNSTIEANREEEKKQMNSGLDKIAKFSKEIEDLNKGIDEASKIQVVSSPHDPNFVKKLTNHFFNVADITLRVNSEKKRPAEDSVEEELKQRRFALGKITEVAEALGKGGEEIKKTNFTLKGDDKDITKIPLEQIEIVQDLLKAIKEINDDNDKLLEKQLKDEKPHIDKIKKLVPEIQSDIARVGGNIIAVSSENDKIATLIPQQFKNLAGLSELINNIPNKERLNILEPRDQKIKQKAEDNKNIIGKVGEIVDINEAMKGENFTILSGKNDLTDALLQRNQKLADLFDKLEEVNAESDPDLPSSDLNSLKNDQLLQIDNIVKELTRQSNEMEALAGKDGLPKPIQDRIEDIEKLSKLIKKANQNFIKIQNDPLPTQIQKKNKHFKDISDQSEKLKPQDEIILEIPSKGSSPSTPINSDQLKQVARENAKLHSLLKSLNEKLKNSNNNATGLLEEIKNDMQPIIIPNVSIKKLKCAPSSDPSVCIVKDLQVMKSSEKISEVVRGSASVDSKKIKKIIIDGQPLWFLPEHFSSFFPDLEDLTITNSQFLSLQPNDLKEFKSLKNLKLNNNELKDITPDVFSSLENLEKLDLSHNHINKIDPKTFKNLKSLKEIRLNDNKLGSIKSDIFSPNEKLDKVWLNNNQLTELNPKFVNHMEKIAYVNLKKNKCTDVIYQGSTRDLEAIREKCSSGIMLNCIYSDDYKCTAVGLDVQKPKIKITELSGDHLAGKSNKDVNELIVRDQTVLFMPEGVDELFPRLQSITIDNSKLSKISKADFSSIPALKELMIRKNVIESIDPDSFDNNLQLEKIDLGENQLKVIPEKLFAKLPSIKTLMLNNNDIEELHMNVIDCPASIRHFDFSNNAKLKSVQANIANICLKNAPYIDFSKVNCINIDDYKIESGNIRLHDEMFGVLETNCRFAGN
jgi:Leucine-rich repeat (LRR) protein